MEDNKFAKGIFFDKPRPNSPEFVRGRLSIKKLEAIAYLSALEPSEAGFINFDLLKSKDGTKLYFTLNDWKPEKKMTDKEADAIFDGGASQLTKEDSPF